MKPTTPTKSRKEITLEQWADSKKKSRRTASHWAKIGKIPAVKRKVTMEVTRFVTVTKYMIAANAKLPDDVK